MLLSGTRWKDDACVEESDDGLVALRLSLATADGRGVSWINEVLEGGEGRGGIPPIRRCSHPAPYGP